MDSPVVASSHTFLVHGAIQLFSIWEDAFMMDDDGLHDFIHVCLARYLVLYFWNRHQRWAEANGQIVRVHHVLVAVLGKAADRSKKSLSMGSWGKRVLNRILCILNLFYLKKCVMHLYMCVH